MNANHHFEIGKGHIVCEDYATSGVVANGAYAILCDGCSSSPDVDFGARALALSAKRTLSIGGTEMNYDLFGKITIRHLEHIGDTFPTLDPRALDATLLVTWVKGDTFTAHMYGDGIFFHKTASTLRFVYVDFETNTPAYLSYYLDKLRLKEYEEKVQGSKHVFDVSYYMGGPDEQPRDPIEVESYINPFAPVTFKGKVSEGDIIAISSDGLTQFKRGDGSSILWDAIARDMIDFKSLPGVFVQRRLSFLERQWKKEQITHLDDVSMAAIAMYE